MKDDTPTVSYIISEWHAISTSIPSIKVDGVIYQDIVTIINTFLQKQVVLDWDTVTAALYDHVVDMRNPHKLTIDDFKISCISLLYSCFTQEGYTGTLEEFITRIFQEIKIGVYSDLTKALTDETGIYEKVVTTVKMVADYIKEHNATVSTETHANIFSEIIYGSPVDTEPLLSLYRYLGVDADIENFYSSDTGMYMGYPLGEGVGIPAEFTVVTTIPVSNATYEECFGFFGWDLSCGFDQKPFSSVEPLSSAVMLNTYKKPTTVTPPEETPSTPTVPTTVKKSAYQASFGFSGWNLAQGFDLAPFESVAPLTGADVPYGKYWPSFGFEGWDLACGFDQYPFNTLEFSDDEETIPEVSYSPAFGFQGWDLASGFDQLPFSHLEPTLVDDILTGKFYSAKDPSHKLLTWLNTRTNNYVVWYTAGSETINLLTVPITDIVNALKNNPTLTIVLTVTETDLSLLFEDGTVFTQAHATTLDPTRRNFDRVDIPEISKTSAIESFAVYPASFTERQRTFVYGVFDNSFK